MQLVYVNVQEAGSVISDSTFLSYRGETQAGVTVQYKLNEMLGSYIVI